MQFDTSARRAFVVVLATLAIGGLGMRVAMQALGIYLKKEPVEMRGDFSTIPAVLGNWKKVGEDEVLDAATVEALGTSKYLTRSYALDGDRSRGVLSLHLAYYTGMIDTVPHIPTRCLQAAGLLQLQGEQLLPLTVTMEKQVAADVPPNAATGLPYETTELIDPITGAAERVKLPLGELGLTASRFQHPQRNQQILHVGYMFIANGRATPSTFGVRKLSFEISEKYAYFCKIQLSAQYPATDEHAMDLFQHQSEDFMRELLPHMMRRLPDWSSIEALTHKPAS